MCTKATHSYLADSIWRGWNFLFGTCIRCWLYVSLLSTLTGSSFLFFLSLLCSSSLWLVVWMSMNAARCLIWLKLYNTFFFCTDQVEKCYCFSFFSVVILLIPRFGIVASQNPAWTVGALHAGRRCSSRSRDSCQWIRLAGLQFGWTTGWAATAGYLHRRSGGCPGNRWLSCGQDPEVVSCRPSPSSLSDQWTI